MAKSEASVEELVAMIQRGELRLPEMQRRYVWKAPRVRDLLDSLYRGYPSGAILLWDTDENVPMQDFAISQATSPYSNAKLLLDGQQRLTSLSAVILGEPVEVRNRAKPIDLLFNLDHPEHLSVVTEVDEDPDDEEDLGQDEADSNEDELQSLFDRMTFVVSTKKLAALPNWVKVSEVFKTNEDAPFLQRAGIENFSDPRYTKYSQRLARLRGIRKYSYRMDVLERTLSYDEVTEIFVRVNSLGSKLRSSDLALAQITAKWRGSLTVFQEFEKKSKKAGFDVGLAIHLKNMVAFATGQSRFSTVGGLSAATLRAAWEECQRGMEFAINYLKSNTGIDSPALLSSPFIMVALAYFGHQRDYELTSAEAERLRYWSLTANAKGRYSRGSSETLLDQDLATLRDGGDVDALVDRLKTQVGRLDISPEEMAGRNQRSAIFKTMFLAFRDGQAKDWNSNLTISLDHSGAQHKLQFHHIFPKAVLTAAGRTTREADDIANLAFIGGKTNRKINATPPSIYLAKLRDDHGPAMFQAQCIPVDDDLIEIERYDRFLARRREQVAEQLNVFLGTEGRGRPEPRLDPHLRQLDDRVERIELDLRRLLVRDLDGTLDQLPGHIIQNVKDRVRSAERRNPTIAGGHQTLEGKLQYLDLRELQSTITSKTLWPRFEAVFGAKVVLDVRFDQLAELRNAVRHSRPLSDVTRKDGEAAVMWFRTVLDHAFTVGQSGLDNGG